MRMHGVRGALYMAGIPDGGTPYPWLFPPDRSVDPPTANDTEIFNITTWSLEINVDNVDVTIIDNMHRVFEAPNWVVKDQVYKDFVSGATEWNGSFEGFIDSVNIPLKSWMDQRHKLVSLRYQWGTADPPTSQNVDENVSDFFQGECLISQMAPSNSRDDAASFSGTFQGTGKLYFPGQLAWFPKP